MNLVQLQNNHTRFPGNIERRQLAVPCGDDAESLAALLNQEDAAITTSNETKDDRELAREWSRAMARAVTLPSAQDFTRVVGFYGFFFIALRFTLQYL